MGELYGERRAALDPYRSAPSDRLPAEAAASLRVERCMACHGHWFDGGQIADAIRRSLLHLIPPAPPAVARQRVDGPCGPCPRCGEPLQLVESQSVELEYDRCPRCKGIWFDPGEALRYADDHVALLALMLYEFD